VQMPAHGGRIAQILLAISPIVRKYSSRTVRMLVKAQRRAGQKSGPDVASVRDQANKTGETKDTVQRSKKRFEDIGDGILEKIVGTNLDKGVQLDALAKLSKEKQHDLAERAAAGETVSARMGNRKSTRGAEKETQHKSLEHAFDEFWTWNVRYGELLRSTGLLEQFDRLLRALSDAICPPEETELPEQTSERPKKRKFVDLLKGRTGD
jgi:hypothetical protein